MNRMKLKAAAGLLATLAHAAPAMAEGGFESSISGGQDGFLSRIWYDGNTDNISTNIYFSGCDRANQNVGLYRQVTGIDPNLGTKTLCSNRKGYWGDLRADDYRFKLIGGSNIDIDFVAVNY